MYIHIISRTHVQADPICHGYLKVFLPNYGSLYLWPVFNAFSSSAWEWMLVCRLFCSVVASAFPTQAKHFAMCNMARATVCPRHRLAAMACTCIFAIAEVMCDEFFLMPLGWGELESTFSPKPEVWLAVRSHLSLSSTSCAVICQHLAPAKKMYIVLRCPHCFQTS